VFHSQPRYSASPHDTVIFVCTRCGSVYEADQGAVTLPTVGHFRCGICGIEVYRWCGAYDYTGWRSYKVRRKKSYRSVQPASPSITKEGVLSLRAASRIIEKRSDQSTPPGEQPHPWAFPLDNQPVAVVLDLMEPVGTGRDLGGYGRNAGLSWRCMAGR
jgi:hypothetical protein